MQTESFDGDREGEVLTYLILDDQVAGAVASQWDRGLFSARWSNIVGELCVRYYRKYGRAPRGSIKNLVRAWGAKRRDSESLRMIESYLSSLSSKWEREGPEDINSQYAIDMMGVHFRTVRAESAAELVKGYLLAGDLDQAEQVFSSYTKVELGQGAVRSPYTDPEMVRSAFGYGEANDVIVYRQGLKSFFAGTLERDALVAFLAPVKSGKCVSSDTEVLLADGRLVSMEDMVRKGITTPVLSLDEQTREFVPTVVTQFWNNGIQECWRVTTRAGRQAVTTANHQFLTRAGWKYLHEVSVGDSIAVPGYLPYFGSVQAEDSKILALACYTASTGKFSDEVLRWDEQSVRLFLRHVLALRSPASTETRVLRIDDERTARRLCHLLVRLGTSHAISRAEGTWEVSVHKEPSPALVWQEVASVEPVGLRETYDLGVEPHHNFVAGDCVVHNTFWLVDMAYHGVVQRRRTVFFEVGDLSERQILQRIYCRAAAHPYRGERWPLTVKIPTKIHPPKGQDSPGATVEYTTKEFPAPLDYTSAWAACQRMVYRRIKSEQPYLQVATYPNFSITALGVRSVVETMANRGFVPDVICLDYADLLAPPVGIREPREQIDITWKQLRALSQEFHCLVVTATQSNAEGFKKHTLDRSNFSGNSRNLAHATAVCGINMTAEEKDQGIVRLNWIAARDKEFSTWRYCYCAGCLAIANPSVCSVYQSSK